MGLNSRMRTQAFERPTGHLLPGTGTYYTGNQDAPSNLETPAWGSLGVISNSSGATEGNIKHLEG